MLALLLVAGLSLAAADGSAGPLARSLVSWVAEVCGAAEVELLWLGVDEDWIAPDDALYWRGQPCRERPTLQLTVLRDGALLARRTLRPGLAVYVEVPLAIADTEAGELVRTAPGRALVQDLRGEPVGEGRWRARGHLDSGEPVTTARVEPMPDVLSGTAVTVVVHRGGLVVRAPGRLLEDAEIGRPVRVVNDATKVALEGVLTAPGVVEIP